jgi:ABC-type branched-subunit amino acid transport system substrate-binding protein
VRAKDATQGSEIEDTDLIFGPMHKTSLAIVSDATRKNGTYLVSPNSFSNKVFEDNRYLLRAEASQETMMRYLANYVAIQHEKDNVLMINSETAGDWPLRKLFIKNYNLATGTFPNAISDSILSITKEDIMPGNVSEWLNEDVPNVLVVPSKELAYVSDLMTKLSRIDRERYEIQIYGLANWMRFENIDAGYKNRFKLRLAVPSYIDYDTDRVTNFLREYRERYNMEPSEYGYGFLGYDLTMFFGKALLDHGLGFPNSFFTNDMEGLGANFRFGKSTTGKEFENKSVYIIEYQDFDIKRVN